MSYSYMPINPEQKLRQHAVKWVTTMQKFHREPNRRVAFVSDSESSPEPTAAGWLLDSSEVPGRRDRYLLLPDGGIWHELVLEPPLAPRPAVAAREWVDKPNDELVTLLGRSVTRVQYGFPDQHALDQADADPVVVADRRRVRRAPPASERRAQA